MATTALSAPPAILSYRDALYQSMHGALARHPRTIILGQGINDHKGTFGTTIDLFREFGTDRVMDVPLCEEATTGVAVGAALNGLYPIHIQMRADFALLAMNQIVNMAAKYRYMSGGRCSVPLLIRLVIGRGWGQGAQHSQSLQSLFAHIPGLTVVMPATAQSVIDTYDGLIGCYPGPVISLEHRLLYDIRFQVGQGGGSPLGSRRIHEGADVTVVATSIMVLEALRAARWLAEHAGITCDVIDLHSPSHPDHTLILDSLRRTGRLLVADTSWAAYGVAAEMSRLVCETDPGLLRRPVAILGMQPAPCPTAKTLEDLYYPHLGTMVDRIAAMVRDRGDHGVPLPDERSMVDIYKRFKGPF